MKTHLFLLIITSILLVSGCTREHVVDADYITIVDGQTITVLFNEGTRSEGTIKSENGVYTFAYSFDGTFTVVYPNGYEYSQRNINGGITSSWSLDKSAEELGFIDGFGLEWAVRNASQSTMGNQRTVSPIISILLIGLGLFNIILPKNLWWLSRGWMYKNVDPSDLALGIYRVIGIIFVFFGIISFFA